MLMYSLVGDNIVGKEFSGFIKCCLKNSTHFSITLHTWGKNRIEQNQAVRALDDYFYKEIQTFLWYSHKTIEAPFPVLIYQSSVSALEEIEHFFIDLFTPKRPELWIEDLCFINNNEFLFGSVSHEGAAHLLLPSESELKKFEEFGEWEKRVLTSRDYSLIPDLRAIIK